MSYYGWKPYVPVAERQKKAAKAVAKAKKSGADLTPIAAYRGAIAKTFWGKAWCDNLERYSDYSNRLPRGRTYVRNGSVIDLKITAGEVRAQVMGSSLYTITATVTAVPQQQWQEIGADCSGSIDSLVELLRGKLSKGVMERICKPGTGLFPSPKEIKFSCSCPDWASMCKHVAAVLYGVGARLDQQPELLFSLRRVDAKDLVAQAGAGLQKPVKRPKAGRILEDSLLADVFGIEMAEVAPPAKPAVQSGKKAAGRANAKTVTKTAADKKKSAPAKIDAVKKTATKKKAAAKPPAGSRKSITGVTTARKTKVAILPATPKNKAVTTKRAGKPKVT